MSALAIKSRAIYIEGMSNAPDPTAAAPAGQPGRPLDEFLCFSVYSAGLAFNRVYKPMLDRFGLTYPQYLVLLALDEQSERTVSDLGQRLHLESNTLTPLMKRLEVAGLVTRTRDKADERVVRVSLTQSGRDLIKEALGCVPSSILEATGLSEDRLAELNQAMIKLGQALRGDS